MNNRFFSDAIKYKIVLNNLDKNEGILKCNNCSKKIKTIHDCHFDHVNPFSKCGESKLSNCEIVCANCNLHKNQKEMNDFVLEEKAKYFIYGNGILVVNEREAVTDKTPYSTKKDLELAVINFVEKMGDINKIDFLREKNNLPPFGLVVRYYGGLKQMKKELGIKTGIQDWNRITIKSAIKIHIENNGNLLQKDLTMKNNLPSLPCILSRYPELKNFNDIKVHFGLNPTRTYWDYSSTIYAGKEFVKKTNGRITEKDFKKTNNLPTTKVIYKLFGSLAKY